MMPRFFLLFGVIFGVLLWLFDGDGPVPVFNEAIEALTAAQTRGAGLLLAALGERVESDVKTLQGEKFYCEIDTGCNGMSAIVLLLAGILSFPGTRWRFRVLGILALVPVILVLNIIRIAALYWTGAHHPRWFGVSHVYFWQTAVIGATVFLWLAWLSWKSRRSAAS
jgi:exosortase/archaeosortase family protein